MLTRDFCLAGRAVFTVHGPNMPKHHFTYRIRRVLPNGKWPEAFFAQLLTGPDNTKSYSYLSKLDPATGEVEITTKSRFSEDSYPVRLLRRVLACIWEQQDRYTAKGFSVMHSGRCGRCGRLLTVPESIELGIGPECIKYHPMLQLTRFLESKLLKLQELL